MSESIYRYDVIDAATGEVIESGEVDLSKTRIPDPNWFPKIYVDDSTEGWRRA